MAIGGAQRVLLDQARWFHEHGHKVTAVFFYDLEGLHDRWQAKEDFSIINLSAFQKKVGILKNTRLLLGGLARLWKLLRSEKPQVVEAFTHDSNMLALPLAWMAGVPVRIATHHGVIVTLPNWRRRIHTWMINIGLAYRIVAVSDLTRQKSLEEGIRADKIQVIVNGIEPISLDGYNKSSIRREIGFAENDLVLISIGRLVYPKAHENLIFAIPDVLKQNEHVRVGILGDGELRDSFEKLIDSLGLRNKVRLFGTQENVPMYLAAADIFVLPSRSEGLPLALLEAMSAGLPVIATRLEGFDKVVEEGVHGLLVPVEDSQALAKAILQLSPDSDQCRKMGEAARKHILENYSIDQMCQQYLRMMEQGLGGKKG